MDFRERPGYVVSCAASAIVTDAHPLDLVVDLRVVNDFAEQRENFGGP